MDAAVLYHEYYQRPVGAPEAPATLQANDLYNEAIEAVIQGTPVEVVFDGLLDTPEG